jgi:hypothetical protein
MREPFQMIKQIASLGRLERLNRLDNFAFKNGTEAAAVQTLRERRALL